MANNATSAALLHLDLRMVQRIPDNTSQPRLKVWPVSVRLLGSDSTPNLSSVQVDTMMFTWYEVVWCCMVRVCFSSHWDGDARTPTSVAPRHHKVTDSQSVAIEVKRKTWCQSTTTWFFEGLISFGIPLQLLANKQSWADSSSNRKGTDIDGGLLCLVLLVPIN